MYLRYIMYDRLIYILLKKKAEKNRFVTMICIIVSWDDYPKSDGTILRNNLVVFLLG